VHKKQPLTILIEVQQLKFGLTLLINTMKLSKNLLKMEDTNSKTKTGALQPKKARKKSLENEFLVKNGQETLKNGKEPQL
jgi:hypothetical protein